MGQVSAIGEDSITLSVMTKPQGAKPSGNPSNNKDFSDRPEGTPPAMKEGEERPVSGGAFHGGEGRAASDGETAKLVTIMNIERGSKSMKSSN